MAGTLDRARPSGACRSRVDVFPPQRPRSLSQSGRDPRGEGPRGEGLRGEGLRGESLRGEDGGVDWALRSLRASVVDSRPVTDEALRRSLGISSETRLRDKVGHRWLGIVGSF